jgi:Uma2 family endonuclease
MSTIFSHDITSETRFTPEDLLNLPDGVNYELVDGKLVERHMGMESSLIALRIGHRISQFLDQHPMGLLFGADASYQCFPDAPDKIRKPDVSFIQNGRLADNKPPQGHCRLAPDLAIEVVSPNDLASEIEEKVAEYRHVGIRLIWIVYPRTRTVSIRRLPQSPLGAGDQAGATDTISGEDVLQGFSCPVKDFFE